jgi:cytochrome d ubiquinol oxidase subunit I
MLIGLDIYLLSVTARAGIHHKPEAQLVAAPAPSYEGAGFQGYDRRD